MNQQQSGALVGQVVVTDPGVGSAGGYILVAASPSVGAADQERLAGLPQVSDFLHLEASPGTYFSWLQLPSGAWAFGKRFAAGKRRGSLNRIVGHSLVVAHELLERIEWEPWLLTSCEFREAESGNERSYDELCSRAGVTGRPRVEDLVAKPPAEPLGQRVELLGRRRAFLCKQWGQEALLRGLRQVLAALESGRGALLPQGAEAEQLLALAWSVLPRHDRQVVAWTTHLAPGGGQSFLMANSPRPEAARAARSDAGAWVLLGEELSGPGSAAVARSIVTGRPPVRDLLEGRYEHELSLRAGGQEVGDWIASLELERPPEEFASLDELTSFLEKPGALRQAVGRAPEGGRELLEAVGATVARLAADNGNRQRAAAAVYEILVRRNLAATLLSVDWVRDIARSTSRAATLEALLELALQASGENRMPQRHVAAQVAIPASVFAEALAAALMVAQARGQRALAAGLAERFVVPQVARQPPLARQLGEALEVALDALQEVPSGLVTALGSWPDAAYDRALAELRRWCAEAPAAARAVAAAVAAGEEARAIRERPSLLGTTEAVARAGADARCWLAFAVAEAAVIDGSRKSEGLVEWQRFLAEARIEPPDAGMRAALATVRALARPEAAPREGHRALLVRLAPALGASAMDTVYGLASLSRLPEGEFQAWGETVARVATELRRAGRSDEAAMVRSNWWLSLASRSWQAPTQQVLAMLRELQGPRAVAVVRGWMPRVEKLGVQPGVQALRQALLAMAASEPALRLELDLAVATRAVRESGSGLPAAVARVASALRGAGESPARLVDAVESLLARAGPVGRLRHLVELLLSQELLPSVKRQLESKLLPASMERAKGRLGEALPSAGVLAHSGSLLLRAAQQYGKAWRNEGEAARRFVRETVELGRFDAVGQFLFAADAKRFLKSVAARDPALAVSLRWASEHPTHRWDLAAARRWIEAWPLQEMEGEEERHRAWRN